MLRYNQRFRQIRLSRDNTGDNGVRCARFLSMPWEAREGTGVSDIPVATYGPMMIAATVASALGLRHLLHHLSEPTLGADERGSQATWESPLKTGMRNEEEAPRGPCCATIETPA